MASIFDIPELLLNVLSFVKEDRLAFVYCLSVTKAWREVVIENAQQLLDDRVYALCQGATVKVGCTDEKNFEFRVPGYQALLLVISGAIEVAQSTDDKLVFRSRDIAERWFRTARRYVDKEPQQRPQPLTIIDWPGIERTTAFVGGKLMAPIVRPKTGQLWFWVWDTYKNKSIAEAKEELLKAFKSTEPHVVVGAAGLGLVGFDGRDRLWFKQGLSEVLHGLGEHEYVTLNSKTRAEAGLPERKQKSPYKEFFHTGEINGISEPICALDHDNRFYVSDTIGVHIIHPDSPNHFDYHSTYKINYEKNIFYEASENFADLHKYVDVTGKLYVWSTSGMSGRSGTVGYWTYDGKQWKNVDMGHDKVYDIVVRVLNDKRQIWVFLARDIKVLEEPLSGDTVPVPVPLTELTGNVDTYNNRVVARSVDRHDSVVFIGTKSFLLDSKHKQREPQQLPDNINTLLKAIDLPRSGWGYNTIMDGVMYFSDDTKIVAASLDGKTVTNYSSTETLSGPRIHHVVKKARKYGKPVTLIYLHGGNLTYLLDTTVKFVDFSGMPGMFVNNLRDRPSAPNPEGHLFFYAQTENQLYQWKANQLPQVQPGEIVNTNNDVVFGNDGLMITRDNYKTFMYQNGKILTAKGLEELVDQHYDTLVKLLPYPPHRASLQYGTNFNVINDGLGNLWVGDREKLSVRTPTGFIHFHTSAHYPDVKNKNEVRIYAIAPLGNGSAVVLIDKHKGLVLKISGQSFEVEDTPIGVKHSVYAYDWKENVFYDKHGEVYVISEEWSMEYQANGMHFKTYPLLNSPMIALRGKLLLIDRHNGKWYYQERINANIPSTLIYRPDQSNAEFKLEISLKAQVANEDFMTDHSVWLHVDSGLTRVKFNGEALDITEQLKMVVPSSTRTALSNGRYVLWGREYDSCSCLALEEKSFK